MDDKFFTSRANRPVLGLLVIALYLIDIVDVDISYRHLKNLVHAKSISEKEESPYKPDSISKAHKSNSSRSIG